MGCASSTAAPVAAAAPTKVVVPSPASAAPAAIGEDSPFQIMILSHQALFYALDALAERTRTGKRDEMPSIRAAANELFGLMKVHARLEDAVYFAAVEAKQPGITGKFSDDHKRSAEGRPALLAKLDAAVESDEAFAEGMGALRKFCEGNRAHQLGEEDVVNPQLTTLFTPAEARELMARVAALDAPAFDGSYTAGIFARLTDTQRVQLLSVLQAVVPAEQYAAIMVTVRAVIASSPPIPVHNPERFQTPSPSAAVTAAPAAIGEDSPFQIMILSHQALFYALDALAERTRTGKRDEMPSIRAAANELFGLMKVHARLEDAVYFAAVEAKQPGITGKFSDDHKRSAEGRPALLAKLDAAVESDEAFAEGMGALRKFCEGNRAHQLGEEDVVNPQLTTLFTPAEARELMARVAALDAPAFDRSYTAGIFARLTDTQRVQLLSVLQAVVPAEQYAAIMVTVRGVVADAAAQHVAVQNAALFA